MISSLLSDIRHAYRHLRQSPGFTAAAALTLALGIGANTALFSAVHGILLRPFPFADPDRLVLISESSKALEQMSVSYPNFEDWRRQNDVFERIAAHRLKSVNLTGAEMPERLLATQVSASLFPMLGIEPAVGRFFLEEEDRPGAESVVVLSHRLWQRRFGGSPEIIGQTVSLDGSSYRVIGAAPRGLYYPLRGGRGGRMTDFYLTIGRSTDSWKTLRNMHPGMLVTARLRPGITIEQARAQMIQIARHLEQEYPESNAGQSARVEGLKAAHVKEVRPALIFLSVAVALVLLIACANVANLLLARGSARSREMAVRAALGAGRSRLVRQLLTESILLSLVGSTLGVLMAMWGVEILNRIIPASMTARYGQIAVDGAVLGFALTLSVLTGLVFGLVPALNITNPRLAASLKEADRSSSGGYQRQNLRNALMVAEVSLALVLLTSATLVFRSFANATTESPGFNPVSLVMMEMSLPRNRYAGGAQRAVFYRQLDEKLAALPGARSAGLGGPFLGGWQNNFVVDGRPAPDPAEADMTDMMAVSPDYFRTMEIPLLEGRFFTEQDQADALQVVILDETFAETYWPGEDPVGKRVKFGHDPADDGPWLEVVGVVGHVKSAGVDAESRVQLYRPYQQWSPSYMSLFIRTDMPAQTMAAAVRREVSQLDPYQPVHGIRTLESHLSDLQVRRRLAVSFISVFAGLALLLSAGGIYALIAYTVSQRTHEIGIRMALGAGAGDVLRFVLHRAMFLTAIGIGIGLLFSFTLTPLMRSQLFKVDVHDPLSFSGTVLVLGLVALLASLAPAWRAVSVEPSTALRYE
jgi:putative ABC transport system permease protein